jgi:II/X family phage/plasmid replication protein
MMVDWLTVEVPDPIGLPVNAGHILKVTPDGSVEWSTAARLPVEGSWSSNMMFRCVGASSADESLHRAQYELGAPSRRSGIEISGNPTKFLQGHNLFGSDCATDLLSRALERAAPKVWPHLDELPEFDLAEASISRIDLTGSWLLDRETDVVPYLRAMEERVWCPFRGRGVMSDVGTLYYGRVVKGKRAKDWQLKLYSKGLEIGVHQLPLPAYSVPGLLDHVNRTIRVELTLRTAELKRLGLTKVGDWTPERVAEIWRSYVAKLDFGEATLNLDTLDLAELGLKARHATALAAWKAGNDLRGCMSRETFYRLRRELKAATGYDIAVRCPKSNVVPLRRMVMASDAGRPEWADALTEALSRAA